MDDDTPLYDGGEVKALGGGKVGGMLVVFGSADQHDLSSHHDYFTKSTDYWHDFDGPVDSVVLYHHGLDPVIRHRKIGRAQLKMTEAGVWAEAQLKLADEYEEKILGMVEAGKLRWSSGTAAHMVERKEVADGVNEVLSWPLGIEASLTPTPAEPRTKVFTIKSLIEHDEPGAVPASLVERSRRAVSDAQEIGALLADCAKSRALVGRGLSAAKAAELDAMIAAHAMVKANLETLRSVPSPRIDDPLFNDLLAEYYVWRTRDLAGRR